MKHGFDETKPIYLQLKERIEDQIISDQLKEGDQIPSTTQLVQFYKINHLTVSKAIHMLVEEGIVYKKRGVGMFTAKGAKEKLLRRRRDQFVDRYLLPMIREAERLGMTEEDVIRLIRQKGRDRG